MNTDFPRQPDKAGPRPLDTDRFGQVYLESWDRLANSLTGLVRDRQSGQDIASQAFAKAWAKRDQFRGEASPSTWIHSIARNEALGAVRADRVKVSLDHAGAREAALPDRVTEALERQEDLQRLKAALDCLPPKHRRALTAHVVDGVPVREIAAREQVPVGTVLSRIFTAKRLLRHAWEKSLSPTNFGPVKQPSYPSETERPQELPQSHNRQQEAELRQSATLDR